MSEPITLETLQKYNNLRGVLKPIEGKIWDRLQFIVDSIHKIYGLKGHEYCIENFYTSIVGGNNTVVIKFDNEYNAQSITVTFNDGTYSLPDTFPIRFLFSNHFNSEIIEAKKKMEDQEIIKKQKAKERNAKRLAKINNDKAVVDGIKSKLSKEELAILKRNL